MLRMFMLFSLLYTFTFALNPAAAKEGVVTIEITSEVPTGSAQVFISGRQGNLASHTLSKGTRLAYEFTPEQLGTGTVDVWDYTTLADGTPVYMSLSAVTVEGTAGLTYRLHVTEKYDIESR